MKRRMLTGVSAAGVLAVGLAVLGLGAAGCSSLAKPELATRLLSLEKNGPARADGLRRTQVQVEVQGDTRDLELIYLKAEAADPQARPGAPIFFVHGTPATLFTWVELIYGAEGFEGLAAGRDVFAIEVAGHGMAPGSLEPYDFERCARFVGAAIQALGLARVHLVGSSYGGEFAWRAALDHPELVASLVLIDSSGYARADDDWLPEEVQMRENSLADLGWLLNSRDRIESALAPHFRQIPPDRIEEFFLVCENRHNWRAMIDLARDENGTRAGEIPNIAVPTLVLWGADDVAYTLEDYGERFAADIPGAELVVLPETGHYPHEERPAEVVAILDRFFDATEVDDRFSRTGEAGR